MPNLVFGSAGGTIVRNRFRQFDIKLPAAQALATSTALRIASTRLAAPPRQPLPFPPALFKAASSAPADVANQQAMHDLYESMFKDLTSAIEFAFNLYRQTAGFTGVVVNGPVAVGGRLQGPGLEGLVRAAPSAATWTGGKTVIRDAVAAGLHMQWSRVELTTSVPGLPWYPSFVAVPSPVAPPTPNTPTPLVALLRDPTAFMAPALKTAMGMCLHGRFDYSDEFFTALSTGLEWALRTWSSAQMVTLALATGPVPTFAPPYVPAGPVVAGTVQPGQHIAS